ncbi:efflux transporter outer membrane subunit [Pseudomonas chlororaphis]|uniref:efflux transporter outer membrane subunit n=1 Tax=Pseudomonas chlororaphis TaxID=587753 RepID=UPI0004BB1114|nr:efflux transporter outer membrane subunit [Pseudomonas chlororaphis]
MNGSQGTQPALALRSFALVALVVALSGCAIGPEYQRDEQPFPERFRNAPELVRTSPEGWWRTFNDPGLSHWVEQALHANQNIAQAAARIEQAQAWFDRARGDQLPVGEIGGQAARRHDSLDSPVGRVSRDSPAFTRNYDYYEGYVGASWELDLFGRLHRQSQAAQAGLEQVSAEWQGIRKAVAAETSDSYLSLLQAHQQRILLKLLLENQRMMVQLEQQRHDATTVGIAVVKQAESKLSALEAELPLVEQQVQIQTHRLAVLVGQSPSEFTVVEFPDVLPAAPAFAGFDNPSELLRSRPDVVIAEQAVVATTAQVGVAMAGYYPSFSLSGVVGFQGTGASSLASSDAVAAAGLINLRWRLFDFARVNAEIKQAKGKQAESLAGYRQALLLATEDVENALVRLNSDRQRAHWMKAALSQQKEKWDAVQKAYMAKKVSRLEDLAAQQQWIATQQQAINAQASVLRSTVRMYRATARR